MKKHEDILPKTLRVEHLNLDYLEHVRSRIEPPPKSNVSADGNPIIIAGKQFARGFGIRGIGRLELDLDGQAIGFRATVGVTDDSIETGPVWFEVIGDDKLLYQSVPVCKGDSALQLSVSLEGVRKLVITVQLPDSFEVLTAIAESNLEYLGARPETVRRTPEEPYILTPPPSKRPCINEPTIFGVRPGSPVCYSVPVSGARPMRFRAVNLPHELALDASTGRVSGSISVEGEYTFSVTAENEHGSDRREICIVVGDRIALTPPMGWNSWYCFGEDVTADDVLESARALVRAGLDQFGYSYINIDDFWTTRPLPDDPLWAELETRARELGYKPLKKPTAIDPSLTGPARDEQGRINSNLRFPDMKAVVDEIHSLGLKAGIYTSPGKLTCGLCAGSMNHEAADAHRFAEWGFDFLKYDWCSRRFFVSRLSRYVSGAEDIPREELIDPMRRMASAISEQARDIVYSLCQYGLGSVWEWAAEIGGNCWRTARDLTDSWSSVSGVGFMQRGWQKHAGPGRWNDLDMIMVGNVWWGKHRRQTRLTPDEQYSYISMWSLQASPLILGNDLRELDEFTLSLLTNREVLAVNQDRLGVAAERIAIDGNLQVWARPLHDGSVAVGLFNRGEIRAEAGVQWTELGIEGPHLVRDLWRQQNLGCHNQRFQVEVPRHGVVLIKLIHNEKIKSE